MQNPGRIPDPQDVADPALAVDVLPDLFDLADSAPGRRLDGPVPAGPSRRTKQEVFDLELQALVRPRTRVGEPFEALEGDPTLATHTEELFTRSDGDPTLAVGAFYDLFNGARCQDHPSAVEGAYLEENLIGELAEQRNVIARLARGLARAFSTLRILPLSGRIAWNRRSRPCLAEPLNLRVRILTLMTAVNPSRMSSPVTLSLSQYPQP